MDEKRWNRLINTANEAAVRDGVRQQIRIEKVDSGAIHTITTPYRPEQEKR